MGGLRWAIVVAVVVVCVSSRVVYKPWDCGVCDAPELWRGAAGLCARLRVCAGAAESLHTYTYIPPILMRPGRLIVQR